MKPKETPLHTKEEWIALEMARRMGAQLEYGWRDSTSQIWYPYAPTASSGANLVRDFSQNKTQLVFRRKS